MKQSFLGVVYVVCAVGEAIAQQPASVQQQVTVTATRSSLSTEDGAQSVRALQREDLQQAPAFTLDDRLRAVPGLELFRRTSSWIANPTTQGISLRGLGSTAASRTLVLSDEVPLTDPFGGWVHWNEIPAAALERVEVVRGGGSDLYGSSAIGGVINAVPVHADSLHREFGLDGGAFNTVHANGIITQTLHRWSALVAGELLHTDGYITLAPEQRGLVDTNSNVRAQSARTEMRWSGDNRSAFLRGNVLDETRQNGTRIQTNATRLWRYQGGVDSSFTKSFAMLRLYGSTQNYRQSFSTVAASRATEQLNRLQRVPSQENGFSAQWSRAWSAITVVTGADMRDVRANDIETPQTVAGAGVTTSISSRQRASGGFGELVWNHAGWSAALSGRVDDFRTFDGVKYVGASPSTLAHTDEVVFSPRFGLVRKLAHGYEVTGSVFRAFRGPTMNELYRTGQVGQQLTLANDTLKSERATGFEFAGEKKGSAGSLRASYFWTAVNRPITTVLLSQTLTSQTLQRANLGQIRSHGLAIDGTLRPATWLQMSGGYQFAIATVTRYPADTTLVGKWIPEVARNAATAQVRLSNRRIGFVNLIARQSGRLYDDTANTALLHGFFRLDVHAERSLGAYLDAYVDAQNLLDRRIEAGRTPNLTLATPQAITLGLRVHLSR